MSSKAEFWEWLQVQGLEPEKLSNELLSALRDGWEQRRCRLDLAFEEALSGDRGILDPPPASYRTRDVMRMRLRWAFFAGARAAEELARMPWSELYAEDQAKDPPGAKRD